MLLVSARYFWIYLFSDFWAVVYMSYQWSTCDPLPSAACPNSHPPHPLSLAAIHPLRGDPLLASPSRPGSAALLLMVSCPLSSPLPPPSPGRRLTWFPPPPVSLTVARLPCYRTRHVSVSCRCLGLPRRSCCRARQPRAD